MLVEALVDFIASLTLGDWLRYFWPFFLIDFARYVLLDGVVIARYLPRRRRQAARQATARKQLFSEQPLVSILVPGKNEGKHIPSLVDSLGHQTYRRLEVIVVDDGSDDDTPKLCRQLERQGKIDRFVRANARGGKASAANVALRWARGKFIVHLDADSHLRYDAIERMVLPLYMDPTVGAVGGDIRVANVSSGFATRLQAIEYLKSITIGRTSASTLGILRIVSGAFGAFRRETLDRLGGWDVGPGLDGDVTLKIRKLGLRIVHEPEAICYTNVPDTFRKLARQRFRWDRSLVRFRLRKHRNLLNPRGGFRKRDFISAAENVFFTLLLKVKWWIYIIQILVLYPTSLPYLFAVNWMLYFTANVVQFSVVQLFFGRTMRPRERNLAVFLPLMPLYMGIYLRLVRTAAQVMELFHKSSYRDRWNPWKVSKVAWSEHL